MSTGQPFAARAGIVFQLIVLALAAVVTAACGSTSVTNVTGPGAVRCAASIGTSSNSVPAPGGTVSVTVDAARDCTWSAQSDTSWLKLASTSGQGAASITVTAASNEAAAARNGSITVNDQRLDLTQEGRGCSISLSGPGGAVPAAGRHDSLTITTLAGCPWTLTSSASWVVPAAAGGTGAATVAYDVQANTDVAREATLSAGAARFIVSQVAAPAAPPCTYTLDASTRDFPASGGNGSVAVTTQAGCNWSVSGGASWITVPTSSGSGSGSVPYSVTANATPAARQATLTIAGRVYTVTQQGITCTVTITPPSQTFTAAGGNGTIQITTPAGCPWTAASSAGWTLLGATSGVGAGQLTYQVQSNPDTAARTASITIGGQTHSVTQSGAAPVCTYDVTPVSRNVVAAGGAFTVHVATGAGCAWTATNSVPSWITIAQGAGSGNGTADVAYTVAANPNPTTRSGTVTIAGKVHTVTQDAAVPVCTYALTPSERTFAPAGGNGTVTVTTGATCPWTAVSDSGFVTVLTPSGAGSGTINYLVLLGAANVDRTATITVNGQVHTVRQHKTN